MNTQSQTAQSKAYGRQMALWMTLYVAGLFGSIYYIKHYDPEPLVRYFLAFLPAIPIGFTILAVLKFMNDSDEFIRAYHIDRFVKATGLMLFGCTLWGFMENFADAPHIELWWVYPAFWFSFGLVSCLPYGRK